jgi:hypothetical protein
MTWHLSIVRTNPPEPGKIALFGPQYELLLWKGGHKKEAEVIEEGGMQKCYSEAQSVQRALRCAGIVSQIDTHLAGYNHVSLEWNSLENVPDVEVE